MNVEMLDDYWADDLLVCDGLAEVGYDDDGSASTEDLRCLVREC